jgi:hypothetical protein
MTRITGQTTAPYFRVFRVFRVFRSSSAVSRLKRPARGTGRGGSPAHDDNRRTRGAVPRLAGTAPRERRPRSDVGATNAPGPAGAGAQRGAHPPCRVRAAWGLGGNTRRRRCSARSLPASPRTQPRPGSAKGTERFCFSAGVRLKGQRVNPKTRTASSRAVAWGERTHNARRYATLPGAEQASLRARRSIQARPRAAWRCLAAAVTSSRTPDSPRTARPERGRRATVGRSFAAATTTGARQRVGAPEARERRSKAAAGGGRRGLHQHGG